VELGYTVYSEFRRRGYASEAAARLMDHAHGARGVSRFVVSISPENVPSLALARKLGFVKVGAQWDEEDGPEDVFLFERERS
jgi:RimJ/RimL family protein N-acetyltransferase